MAMAITQQFRVYRIISTTEPNNMNSLLTGFGSFSRVALEALEPENIGFYADDLAEHRGEQSRTEQFMLQGGDSLDGPWADIKPFQPAAGSDDSEPYFGECSNCSGELTESEDALGTICDSCRPEVYEQRELNQERLAEEAAERRRYPEESDDDYYEDEG